LDKIHSNKCLVWSNVIHTPGVQTSVLFGLQSIRTSFFFGLQSYSTSVLFGLQSYSGFSPFKQLYLDSGPFRLRPNLDYCPLFSRDLYIEHLDSLVNLMTLTMILTINLTMTLTMNLTLTLTRALTTDYGPDLDSDQDPDQDMTVCALTMKLENKCTILF
jgi:hypothetical protein